MEFELALDLGSYICIVRERQKSTKSNFNSSSCCAYMGDFTLISDGSGGAIGEIGGVIKKNGIVSISIFGQMIVVRNENQLPARDASQAYGAF